MLLYTTTTSSTFSNCLREQNKIRCCHSSNIPSNEAEITVIVSLKTYICCPIITCLHTSYVLRERKRSTIENDSVLLLTDDPLGVLSVEDIFCSLNIMFMFVIPCLHKHFGTGEMDVRVFGRSFIYVVAPEIYYTQVLVWISMFCMSISSLCSRTDGSYSLYSTHLTRSRSFG